MSRKAYTLLVGIDEYSTPIPALRGCVNDITAMRTLLTERLASEHFELDARVLVNKEATRQAIIDGFRKHLTRAEGDDLALFYFSGHGSQEPAPPEFWHLEPDRLNETIVCYDSRRDGVYDLADKEIAQLLAEVARKDPHVLVILDCCHSGSGTRTLQDLGIRQTITDSRSRPIDDYLITTDQLINLDTKAPIHLPSGRHVVLSACGDNEEAREIALGGETRGVFSYFLAETVSHYGAQLTYRDLFGRVRALVRSHSSAQSPVLEATELADLSQPFLGGAVGPQRQYFTASFDNTEGWVIDGGAVHGVASREGEETTHLALFTIDATPEQMETRKKAIGTARVVQRLPTRSRITLDFDGKQDQTYKSVVIATPLPTLGVRFEGDEKWLRSLRVGLGEAGPEGGASLIVREADENAELTLTASSKGFRIRRSAEGRQLAVDIAGTDVGAARKAVRRLEHIARWMRIATLRNPASRLPADAMRVEITDTAGTPLIADGGEYSLAYEFRNGKWHPPLFKIKLTNTTNRTVYCALLDLPETFSVNPGLLQGGIVRLGKGEIAWARGGQPISGSVPNEFWNNGMLEIRDLLKLVVSTDIWNPELLEQGDLDVRLQRRGTTKDNVPMHTLDRLVARVQVRHMSAEGGSDAIVDWTTFEMTVSILRPQEAAAVPDEGKTATLADGVTVAGHPKLRADVRLSTAPVASRGAGREVLPAVLRDDTNVQPLLLSSSRSDKVGLSVVELLRVQHHESVTAEAPMRLQVEQPLGADEYVLPVAREGDLFLPLGRAAQRSDDGFIIQIDRLPVPEPDDARSLTGSIRIYLEKIVVNRLGREFRYPLLAAVEQDDHGLRRTVKVEQLQARVASSARIVLFIHGIIGDTNGMVETAFSPSTGLEKLADHYDLVLTFDYENLNTPIEKIALSLQSRLAQIGLASGHGKTLHIVAHSMGGLVSRWFIEKESGNEIVDRLVLLGTPNAGSPWSRIQDWATTSIGIALNGISTVVWPAKVLGMLTKAIEQIDVTLDQMNPGSTLLQTLSASENPRIDYRIVAGNTAVLADQKESSGRAGLLARIVRRLAPRRLAHEVATLAFFGKPNDLAVGVDSIKRIPAVSATVDEIGCDHLTYFSSAEGQRALGRALE